ncbi:MAG TPA: hypothetical protein VFG50_07700 [Rhodothermales bacterium]|nr:hypothetical protein [Rhodothermales bacterium]
MGNISAFASAIIAIVVYLVFLAATVIAVLITIRTLQRIATAQESAARYLEEIAERLHDRPL